MRISDWSSDVCSSDLEAINLVAQAWGRSQLKPGDEIIGSGMEHHSNIVPWQLACEATGAVLKVIPITDSGELRLDDYRALLTERTRLVAIAHISNALGTINPVAAMVRLRSDERRVGNECVSTCRSRWSPYH